MNETDLVLAAIILAFVVRDGLLALWLVNRASPHAAVAPAPVPVGTAPIGTAPGPVGVPSPVPAPVVLTPRNTAITATTFGGVGDTNASAYGGMVNPTSAGVALPFHFPGVRPNVRCYYGGKHVDCAIVDVGPWNINDPYWTNNNRPEAESGTDSTGRSTNLAGIDLTPGAWSALGVDVDANDFPGKLKVDWDFTSYLDGTAAPTASVPAPVSSGTPAWVTLGRTYNGLTWSQNSGAMPPKIVSWMAHIGAAFPEMAPYCQGLQNAGAKGWWPWCGLFVQAMLSYSNIRGPMSDAGLKGEETTSDWAYAASWASWGTKVWMPSDGDISNAQPQVGDVLVWSFGHVSFYDHPEPDTDDFSSLGGDQGTPLRVCIADIDMGSCIAIRRPPT